MERPESREQQMEGSFEKVKQEAGFLLKDAQDGNWTEVSASELERQIDDFKGGMTGENWDEILGTIGQAEKLYKAAKEKGDVPEEQVATIDKLFNSLKVS